MKNAKLLYTTRVYTSEIFENCTSRLYQQGTKLYLHKDSMRWNGDTGSFHTYKFQLCPADAINVRKFLQDAATAPNDLDDYLIYECTIPNKLQ